MENKYNEYKQQFKKSEKRLQNRSTLLGLIKFALLMVFCVFLWRGIQTGYQTYSLVGMILSFFVSVPVWIYHSFVTTNIKKYQAKEEIVQRYIGRIQGKWSEFPEQGDAFVDYQHPYTYDLDIFGKKSLFQFLNVAGTKHGKEQLFRDLENPQYTTEEILARQKSIAELSQEEQDSF